MTPTVIKADLIAIKPFRALFLHENSFQFTHNKCHDYGWSDDYLVLADEAPIGYGSVWGKDKREDRDTIFEFYLIPPFRKFSNTIFPLFCSASGASYIESQSNDNLLSEMMYEYAHDIYAESILFEDQVPVRFSVEGAAIHKLPEESNGHPHDLAYILQWNDQTVASGGMMLNYNMPYVDLYYAVVENYRQKGLGSYFIGELKREAYLMGRVPAARCNINNKISKASLIKAGFRVCGHILIGKIKKVD